MRKGQTSVSDICIEVPWFAQVRLASPFMADQDVAYAGYGGCIGLYRYPYWCPQAGWVPPTADSLN